MEKTQSRQGSSGIAVASGKSAASTSDIRSTARHEAICTPEYGIREECAREDLNFIIRELQKLPMRQDEIRSPKLYTYNTNRAGMSSQGLQEIECIREEMKGFSRKLQSVPKEALTNSELERIKSLDKKGRELLLSEWVK